MADDSGGQIRVVLEGSEKLVSGLVATTTCGDLLDALGQSRSLSSLSRPLYLFEVWRSFQRRVGHDELVVPIINQWGAFEDEVKFVARPLSAEEQNVDIFEEQRKKARFPKVPCGRRPRVHGAISIERAVAKARYAPVRRAARQQLVEAKREANERTAERRAVLEEESRLAQQLKGLQRELEGLQLELEDKKQQLEEDQHEKDKVELEPTAQRLAAEVERLNQELTVRSKLRAHRHSKLQSLNSELASVSDAVQNDQQKLEQLLKKLELKGKDITSLKRGLDMTVTSVPQAGGILGDSEDVVTHDHQEVRLSREESLSFVKQQEPLPTAEEDTQSSCSLSSLDSDSNLV